MNYASLNTVSSSLGDQADSIDGTVATDYFNGLSSSFGGVYSAAAAAFDRLAGNSTNANRCAV